LLLMLLAMLFNIAAMLSPAFAAAAPLLMPAD